MIIVNLVISIILLLVSIGYILFHYKSCVPKINKKDPKTIANKKTYAIFLLVALTLGVVSLISTIVCIALIFNNRMPMNCNQILAQAQICRSNNQKIINKLSKEIGDIQKMSFSEQSVSDQAIPTAPYL